MSSEPVVESSGWAHFARGIESLSGLINGPTFPADDASTPAAVHLAEQVVCWLGWNVQYADPALPAFQRQNDLVTPWGGPNADNVYRHARVSPGARYRIRGRMHSCQEFILAVRAGFMHEPVWGTLYHVSASDLGIGPGDEFEIVLGGETPGDGVVPLPDGAAMVSIREYYFDWTPDEPAVFTIQCLDHRVAGGDVPPADEQLRGAVAAVEHSIVNWNRYLLDHRRAATDNVLAPPMTVSKGLPEARYAFCFWALGNDDALVLETTVPRARYWSAQLYELAWFRLIDPEIRQSSLNHRQMVVGDDDRIRVVVSGRDPGVVNWLDTGGRSSGLLTFRWFWSEADPVATTTVMPVDRAAAELAGQHCTPSQRAAALAARRAHLAWRFRT